jgi:ribosomal protein S18 acetylase RimI-like enzyme
MKRAACRIVPLRSGHVPACREIVDESDPWKRLKESIDFRTALRDKSMRTFVCLLDTDVAGFILFLPGPVFARGGYLRAIGVSPRFRGQGVGTALLSHAEKIASQRASHFFLCVSSFNRTGQAFYKRCGYRKVGSLPGFITPGASELIYWKPLKNSLRRLKPAATKS